jgi:hypothetical protein
MQRLLTQTYGWNISDFKILTDDAHSSLTPTRMNICAALQWLASGVQPGDVLFFHFSGHGAQQEDPQGVEEDGMNETILPIDFKSSGMITDDQISAMIVHPLPGGSKMTAVMDSCHSGTGMDLPYKWARHGWREETNPHFSAADVQLFSGCADDDCSADSAGMYQAPGGAMTTALCETLRSYPAPTYSNLMQQMHYVLRQKGFSQKPQLSSTQAFEFDRTFLLDDITPNRNHQLGRVFRRRFPPRPRKIHGPLSDMLTVALGVGAGMVMMDFASAVLFG